MNLDRDKKASPMYYQIKEYIKEKIENGEYKVGDFLPSEINFKNEFNVSRATVTKAVDELLKEGYISRERGRGTMVINSIPQTTFRNVLVQSENFLIKSLDDYDKDVHLLSVDKSSDYAEILKLNPSVELISIEIEVSYDNEKIGFFQSLISKSLNLPKNKYEIGLDLCDTLEKYNDINIIKKKDLIELVGCPKYLCDIFSVKETYYFVKTRRIYYDDKDNIVSYTISYIKPLHYKYFIELLR
ncbi:GntR family transcriptional regulator [Clostridium intestinale]|uniref:GntR family transcriptional regulator n=1 Tax=Clostridium intestinale TaxID=36845 RepID=UPI0028F144AD|nr:GntR family transcriptional regulator [Clostridium intestinale]